MEEQKNHVFPSNYVTIIHLKQRWLEEKERRQIELEKPEEQSRDQQQEIQPLERPEEIRLMERLNLQATETDSQAWNRHRRGKSKNQRTTEASRVKEEKNPKSEGEPTQDPNCEVAMKHRERLPEISAKKLRGRGRNTDEKRRTENVDRIWEIGRKSKNLLIHDETKTEDNSRSAKQNNGFREGDKDARVNTRLLNRQNMQKEKGGAMVWVRK